MKNDRSLNVASRILLIANWLNWASVAVSITALLLSFIFGDWLAGQLATKYHGQNVGETIATIRALTLLCPLAGLAVHQILTRLRAIVATVRAGDPFIAANAARLHRIGWALLVLQLLDLALGGIVLVLDRLGVEHGTWTPGITGWIAALMIFVLARVFRVGAAMRDDLAMTV